MKIGDRVEATIILEIDGIRKDTWGDIIVSGIIRDDQKSYYVSIPQVACQIVEEAPSAK